MIVKANSPFRGKVEFGIVEAYNSKSVMGPYGTVRSIISGDLLRIDQKTCRFIEETDEGPWFSTKPSGRWPNQGDAVVFIRGSITANQATVVVWGLRHFWDRITNTRAISKSRATISEMNNHMTDLFKSADKELKEKEDDQKKFRERQLSKAQILTL